MIFHLPKGSERGNFRYGIIHAKCHVRSSSREGLGSCPQFSICSYSDTIREVLGLNNRMIVCGMAVGVPDESATVNTFIPDRLSVNKYTQWFD